MRSFAMFALNQLKDQKTTVLVENRFSTVALVKNKHRTALHIDKLRGYLVGRTLENSTHVSFSDLWARVKPWMAKKGLLDAKLGGTRGPYVTKLQEEEKTKDVLFRQTGALL